MFPGIVILTTALLLHEEEVLKAIVESVKETTIYLDKDLTWSAGNCHHHRGLVWPILHITINAIIVINTTTAINIAIEISNPKTDQQERVAGQADVELQGKRRQQLLARHEPQQGL